MSDNKGDPDNLLHFKLGVKSDKVGRRQRGNISVDPEDVIAAGAVIVALIFAVAMVFQWVTINVYTTGIVACAGAAAVIAKLVQARRRRNGSVTKHPRNHR
jgi:hypothetical protein